ncbi:MAG: sensor histidine kinase [Alphaproteobacteria bacterium]|nr:sensor histidine kinase [Alphaproteobacteria bacterium]
MFSLWQNLSRKIDKIMSAEAQHAASLDNFALLQAEAHHRIKNQLQLIASLLRRDAEKMTDLKTAQNSLRHNAERIAAIGLVHDLLTAPTRTHLNLAETGTNISNSLATKDIFLPDYLAKLCQILAVLALDELGVSCDSDGDAVWLPMEDATRIGLIVCEIITNAVKHAFGSDKFAETGGGGGDRQVTLALRRDSGGSCRLLIMDNGQGGRDSEHFAPNRAGGGHILSDFSNGASQKGLGLLQGLAAPFGQISQQSGRFGTIFCVEFSSAAAPRPLPINQRK